MLFNLGTSTEFRDLTINVSPDIFSKRDFINDTIDTLNSD